MRLIAALCLCALAALPAAARPLDRAETRGLQEALDAYSDALVSGDAAALTASLPSRLIRVHARSAGLSESDLTDAMARQTRAMMADTRFGALRADPAGAEAADATLQDGTRVTWAILPASFEMAQGGQRSRVSQPVLALRDGRAWYLIRIDAGQQAVLATVYPFLADVALPAASIEPVN
jgi:hypothetical protein